MDEFGSDQNSALSVEEASIAYEVSQALISTGRFMPRQLHVCIADDAVILRGRVADYHQKQLAQVAALAVIGMGELRNEVEVVQLQRLS